MRLDGMVSQVEGSLRAPLVQISIKTDVKSVQMAYFDFDHCVFYPLLLIEMGFRQFPEPFGRFLN